MINKNIQIWRGFDTPPTNYHLWLKEDSLYKYNGEEWIPISSSGGSGIIAVESLADLPEDAEIGSLASVNYQYTKEFEVIDEFKLEDSYLMEENAKPIKKFLIKDSYNWPTNIEGNYAIVGTHPSLIVDLTLYYEYSEGLPNLYLDMYIEHVSGLVITPEGYNLITYNEETGKYEIPAMIPYMLNGIFKEIDFYLVGKFNYGTEEIEKLSTSELNFFGLFFNYDNSYSYTEDFDTNDLLFNTFKGWIRRNDVEIVSDESELNNDTPAGSIASVDVDNYEEYWAKPSELTSLPIWKLDTSNPEQIESPDTIGLILQELVSFLFNISPVKQIKINCPWTHISQVPQLLKLGKNITCIMVPKHMNMMNMDTFPQLTIWADDNTFEIFDATSDSAPIAYTDDFGNIHVVDMGLTLFNAELAALDHYWATCTHKDANNEHTFDASHLIDDLISVKTCKGEVKTDFFLKDKTQWKLFASLTDDKVKGIFLNSESVKFKGYVNVDTLKDVDRVYDSLNVNEMALAVPSTAVIGMMSNLESESPSPSIPLAMDSYLPWAISGIRDSYIELSPELFNIGVTVGVDSGFELRTYFMLDKDSPLVRCPDMLLFAKVELNLKELVGNLLTTLVGVPIDLPETIVASVGKVLRFGGSSGGGSLKTLDNGVILDGCTQTGVVPYKSSLDLPTNDYFTIFIQCPKDTDHNNFYHVQQTAYGRTGNAIGRVWTRLCLINNVSGAYEKYVWREVGVDESYLNSISSTVNSLNTKVTNHITDATANIPSLTHDKYGYDYDMDRAVNTGIINYTTKCTKGLPGGIKENYTVLVFGSSDYDPDYRTVQQIAYGRTEAAANRVWTRLIFKHKNSTSQDNYLPWVEVTNPAQASLTEGSVTADKLGDDVKAMIANSGVPVANSSDSLPTDAATGSFASIVVDGKTKLWVKNDTGWQEYGKESDPEEITNITDIL